MRSYYQTIEQLPSPKCQIACVLKMLIESDGVSERDTPFNGFRTRISELKREYGLNVKTLKQEFISQFGRKSYYNKHYLLEFDKDQAIELYNKINL